MKKLCLGVLSLALVLLSAGAASAEPCGLCQAFYPCDRPCQHCVEGNGGPGLWEIDGGCWGEIVEGTCGDTGNCGAPPCISTWTPGTAVEEEIAPEQDVEPSPIPVPDEPASH